MLLSVAIRAGIALLIAGFDVGAQIASLSTNSSSPVRMAYDCRRATTPPTIDGDLSDACWSGAPWALIGQSQARAKLLWDDVFLYFAAEITDATPRRVHKDRDTNVWEDDCFEIYLSPDPRSGACYELDFNSAGAIFDALRFPRLLPGWTAPSLEARTRPREGGWTIEGRVRLDEFVGANHLPPHHDGRWGMNLYCLDAPAQGGTPAEHAWNPTAAFEDTRRFGVLRFVDDEGHATDRRSAELARFLLETNRLESATPVIGPNTVVSSPALGAYPRQEKGWIAAGGFGRFTPVQAGPGTLPCWRARPNRGDDPTRVEAVVERDSVLAVLGRMAPEHVALIEQGSADGVWLSVRVGEQASRLHLRRPDWRAITLPVKRGDRVRLVVDAGPARNLTGDSVQLSALLLPPHAADPGLPDGWRAFGEPWMTRPDPMGKRAAIRVTATDHFTGARHEIPVTPGATLYRVTGQVRGELTGTTRAHVGIDYLDKDGKFIRQATTRYALQDHLRWGLHNLGGKSDWARFVAYAYDVPPEAATLSLWLGVNAWEAPDADGRAWFAEIEVEAVPRDERFLLGFPPLTWKPDKPAPSRKRGYALSCTPIAAYQLPTMPPPEAKDARALETISWPGAIEAVSFTIHAFEDLGEVRVEVSDLKAGGKATIPASRIDVRKVCYLDRKRDLMMGHEYLLSPNHLEPFEKLAVAPNQSQQCWLTIRVPADAGAGRYQGAVRVVPRRGDVKTMKLAVDVLPIRPRTRPGLLLGMYSYYMKNETPAQLRAMLEDMRAHGMTTTFHFNGGIRIPIEPDPDGRAVIRWDQPNQLRDLFDGYRDAGFTEPLLLLAPDAIFEAAKKFGGEKRFAAVYRDLFEQVRTEGATRRWPAFVVAPYDEGYPYPIADVRFERTRVCAPALRAAGIPIALHALNHPTERAFRFAREFENWTDVNLLTFCHSPVAVGPTYRGYESWAQYRDAMRNQGQRVLFYNPDTTGVHPEAMRFIYGVGLWRLQADGVMDWHYNEHTRGEAYTMERKQRFAPMDFVFSAADGHAGGPTIGWEAAREGAKDYQLLYTLDRLIAEARQAANSGLCRKAEQASTEVNRFLDKLRFDQLDSTGALTLGRWDTEEVDDRDVKHLRGQFKIPNGFAMEDYDRLRKLVCEKIVELSLGHRTMKER
ncbi:MAG: sugar-binding protein [Verrucomicrobiia bacterium]